MAHSVSLQQVRVIHNLAGVSLMAVKPVASLLPCVFVLGFKSSGCGASAAVHSGFPQASTGKLNVPSAWGSSFINAKRHSFLIIFSPEATLHVA